MRVISLYTSGLLHWHQGNRVVAYQWSNSGGYETNWLVIHVNHNQTQPCSNGLMQDCSIFIADALEILQSCINPSMYPCIHCRSIEGKYQSFKICLLWKISSWHEARACYILGADSVSRYGLTCIWIHIMKIGRSYHRFISKTGFIMLVRRYIYIDSGPRSCKAMCGRDII